MDRKLIESHLIFLQFLHIFEVFIQAFDWIVTYIVNIYDYYHHPDIDQTVKSKLEEKKIEHTL